MADIDGNGMADVCLRVSTSIACWLASGSGHPTWVGGPALSDAAGWAAPAYYASIRFADVTGDGKADVCARGASGVACWPSLGTSFSSSFRVGPGATDALGFAAPRYHAPMGLADFDGDGRADVAIRTLDGVVVQRVVVPWSPN